jgi:hypothetical protein
VIRTKNNINAVWKTNLKLPTQLLFGSHKKYVSGPFDIPTLTEFRVNPQMAVVPPGNIWPIVNLSAPKCRPPKNDQKPAKIPENFMSTTKEFSYAALNCGFNTKIVKFDGDNA